MGNSGKLFKKRGKNMKKIKGIILTAFVFFCFALASCGGSQENKYTITFKNDDGTTIVEVKGVEGETIEIADATKPATAEYTYTFAGWDSEVEEISEDKTYT